MEKKEGNKTKYIDNRKLSIIVFSVTAQRGWVKPTPKRGTSYPKADLQHDRSGRWKFRHEGISLQSAPDIFQYRKSLFLKGGDVTSDPTKDFRSLLPSEGTGYFLLEFDHPDDPLGFIVGKRW